MKCNKCGKEFDGNFCPRCGNPALEKKEETETNVKNKKAESGLSAESKDVLQGAFVMYMYSRLKFLFLGAFISAVCAFSMGKILSGIMLAAAGALLMPPVLKKFKGKQRIYVIIAIVVCLGIGIFTGLDVKQSDQTSENEVVETKEGENTDKKENADVVAEQGKLDKKQVQVGNAVLFTGADESKQVLTIESCEPYTDSLGTFTRVNYKIENTGDIEVYTVDWNFQLYADNQVVQTYICTENTSGSMTLGSGRSLSASTYYELDPSTASVIELECYDIVITLKDENAGINSFVEKTEANSDADRTSFSINNSGELEGSATMKVGKDTYTVKDKMSLEEVSFEESIKTEDEVGSITSTIGIKRKNDNGWTPLPVPAVEPEPIQLPQFEAPDINWGYVAAGVAVGVIIAGAIVLAPETGGASLVALAVV